MLPLRGLRDAVSKSNSVSFVPSTTTTRVSSGWLASISMRRAIGALLETLGTTSGASNRRALPPLWREGDGAFRPAERPTRNENWDGQDGEASRRRTGVPVLPTSRFLMSRPASADPIRGAASCGRLLAPATYGVRPKPTNQKIENEQIAVSR